MEKAKNIKIRKILNGFYLHHSKILENYSLIMFIDEYLSEWDSYYKSMGINNYKSDDEAKELLEFKKNNTIIAAFDNVKKMNIDEDLVIQNFEVQIKESLLKYESIIKETGNNNIEYQSLFIEDDHFPTGFIGIYGKGNFEILDKPKHLDFDFNNQLFDENCKIDYSPLLQKKINFDELMEELGLDNYLLDSEFYNSLSEMYRYKIYLLLHVAFDNIVFDDFLILKNFKPFYIFANEHDCEVSNIYIFE